MEHVPEFVSSDLDCNETLVPESESTSNGPPSNTTHTNLEQALGHYYLQYLISIYRPDWNVSYAHGPTNTVPESESSYNGPPSNTAHPNLQQAMGDYFLQYLNSISRPDWNVSYAHGPTYTVPESESSYNGPPSNSTHPNLLQAMGHYFLQYLNSIYRPDWNVSYAHGPNYTVEEAVSDYTTATSTITHPNQQQAMIACVPENPNCTNNSPIGYAEPTMHSQQHKKVKEGRCNYTTATSTITHPNQQQAIGTCFPEYPNWTNSSHIGYAEPTMNSQQDKKVKEGGSNNTTATSTITHPNQQKAMVASVPENPNCKNNSHIGYAEPTINSQQDKKVEESVSIYKGSTSTTTHTTQQEAMGIDVQDNQNVRTHTNEMPFACTQCSYRSRWSTYLVTHMRTHTNQNQLSCSQCSYKTFNPSTFVRHMRTHTNERPFACTQCSYIASERVQLVIHKRTHQNKKPFACTQCSYRDSQRNKLVTHMRIHTNEKPFACTQCSYRSSQRNNLVTHMRIHTNEKPFACTHCSYRASQRATLVRHMRIHTNEKPFACTHCSYRASQRSTLVRHMRIHTNV